LGHEGGKVVSPLHLLSLPPGNIPGIHFIVLPEGLRKWKIPTTLSGIESATCRLVTPCLNQLRHRKTKFRTRSDKDEQAFEGVQHFRYLGALLDSAYEKVSK